MTLEEKVAQLGSKFSALMAADRVTPAEVSSAREVPIGEARVVRDGLEVEQVRDVLNKHLSTDKLVIVSAGPTVPQKPLPAPTDKPSEQPLGVPEH